MLIHEKVRENYELLMDLFVCCYQDVEYGLYIKNETKGDQVEILKQSLYFKNGIEVINNYTKLNSISYYSFPLTEYDKLYFVFQTKKLENDIMRYTKKLFELFVLIYFDWFHFDYSFLKELQTLNPTFLMELLFETEIYYHSYICLEQKKVYYDSNMEIPNVEDLNRCDWYTSSLELRLSLLKKKELSNFKNIFEMNGQLYDAYFYIIEQDNGSINQRVDFLLAPKSRANSLREFVEHTNLTEPLERPITFSMMGVTLAEGYENANSQIDFLECTCVVLLDEQAKNLFGTAVEKFYFNQLIDINRSCNEKFIKTQRKALEKLDISKPFSFHMEFLNFKNEYCYIELYGIKVYHEDQSYILLIAKNIVLARNNLILENIELEHSLKVLSGTIAHDFNNVLMGVNVYLNLLKKDSSLSQNALFILEKIDYYAKTLANLSNRLLNYTNNDNEYTDSFDIISLISNVIENIKYSFPSTIALDVDFDTSSTSVKGNFINMKSSFLEILLNFRQMITHVGRVSVTTRIKQQVFNLESYTNHTLLQPVSKYLEIKISTLKPEEMNYEYYHFMTKRLSELLHDVMYKTLETSNEVAFLMLLPCLEDKNVMEDVIYDKTYKNEEYNIMIIDDDAIVIEALVTMLSNYGFNANAFTNPIEAIAYYQSNLNKIDLIVLDMIMPTLSGEEVFYKLKEIDPEVKVMIVSGFSHEGKVEALLEEGALEYIKKPINVKKFITKISNVLYKVNKTGQVRYLNKEYALSMLDNNERVYQKLLRRYYDEYEFSNDMIQTFLKDEKYEEIRNVVHKMKGLSLNLGSHILFEEAKKLENDLATSVYHQEDIIQFVILHDKILKEIKNGLEINV